ncbi:MAG: LysE family translocator [Betaproteobacteria bacterium]|nr:LysE family translocator [Betaproteobacteria bacterium]
MFGTHDLLLFIISGLLLNITPGVDFIYVLSRGAAQGFRAGVWASLGIGAGCFVHIVAAALGLSAILATSAMAFTVVKWIGAAYLVYVGISMLRSRASVTQIDALPQSSASKIFWQGFLTNVLNPKVALFFLAFVPQFIDAASPTKVSAFLFLGVIFNLNGTLWNIFVAWISARLLGHLGAASSVGVWINRTLGAFFIGLGVKLALSERT